MCNPPKYKLCSVCILCIEPLYVHLTPGVEFFFFETKTRFSSFCWQRLQRRNWVRETAHPKSEFCQYLHTLTLFLTGLNCFGLYRESQWGPKQMRHSQYAGTGSESLWNDMRLSEWWQDLNFYVNDPPLKGNWDTGTMHVHRGIS